MPRLISTSYRRSIEAQYSPDVDLLMIELTHPDLLKPVRIVNNTIDIKTDANDPDDDIWIGIPFDITILTDDDQPPKAQLTVQNVDMKIGEGVEALTTSARMMIQLMCSADFDLTVRPHVPLASTDPHIEYQAKFLFLTNVKVDAMQLTGDIVGWDYLQRAWPGQRATKDAFPALFR